MSEDELNKFAKEFWGKEFPKYSWNTIKLCASFLKDPEKFKDESLKRGNTIEAVREFEKFSLLMQRQWPTQMEILKSQVENANQLKLTKTNIN